LWIRDKVDFLRTEGFQSNIYLEEIEGNSNQQEIKESEYIEFSEYIKEIQNQAQIFG
jgi:fatty acid/phospholipid biosynthesis enzyme